MSATLPIKAGFVERYRAARARLGVGTAPKAARFEKNKQLNPAMPHAEREVEATVKTETKPRDLLEVSSRDFLESGGEHSYYSLKNIMRAVVEVRNLTFENKISEGELISHRRSSRLSTNRQIVFYLARTHTTHSLTTIGRLMNRDHSTVMYGIKKIEHDFYLHQEFINQTLYRLYQWTNRDDAGRDA